MLAFFRTRPDEKTPPAKAAVSLVIAAALIVGFFWLSLSRIDYRPDFSFLPEFKIRIWDGFWLTVAVSLASMVVSLLLGSLAAGGEMSRWLPLRYLSRAYVVFIRGTPLIMQIYLFFYLVGTAWGVENRFWAGVIILSVFQGAYISEILRGSFNSIEASQLESARAVGFSPVQTLRFVIIPQMTARTLPALAGQFASVIKDSSLLSMISVTELTQTMREISAVNLNLVECYLFLGVLYLILTLPVVLVSNLLEKRFRYEA
ncbi:MAG: amino acid ABC transporter permease [Sutterella sp.]|jgi:polar amino acid transport system permease protein|uniref:amino acid ABC transporter permease n=1 Tax=Duodenibacillus massiliensis TaxID=1852381 RepID=UPI00094043A0|nr:amino acid ABC transporter permease [Duodenibacillus massiliensis]MBE5701229.1 amino acid ABC transporter permease [Sutterella sp.]